MALQQRAKAFVDTPNDVLRRLLGLSTGPSNGTSNGASVRQILSRAGSKGAKGANGRVGCTPQREYRMAIIEALKELGGGGSTDAVLPTVEKRMRDKLRPADREAMRTGEPRWRLQARFERKNMELEGLLIPKTARGWWELSEKGQNYHE